jgi:hypothetical protein
MAIIEKRKITCIDEDVEILESSLKFTLLVGI